MYFDDRLLQTIYLEEARWRKVDYIRVVSYPDLFLYMYYTHLDCHTYYMPITILIFD
jgi:hypothetical protein